MDVIQATMESSYAEEYVRKQHATGQFTQTELSRQTGISRPHLCGILKRKFWRHV